MSDHNRITKIISDLGWADGLDLRELSDSIFSIICKNTNSSDFYVYVARLENNCSTVLGFVSFSLYRDLLLPCRKIYVSQIAVDEAYRNLSIGTAFLDKVKEIAREKGCCSVTVHSDRLSEAYERSFYQKNGFLEWPEVVNFSWEAS
ncbi:MAG: GNAT family N-acetyltransferase [bacterium]|nr:GNAT family N-acetyltransferase [bacterium]